MNNLPATLTVYPSEDIFGGFMVEELREEDAEWDGTEIDNYVARLFSTSLELFNLAKDLVEYLKDTGGRCDEDCGCFVHSLEALIAKVNNAPTKSTK